MNRFQNTKQPDWDWWGKLWPSPGETLRALGLEPGETLAEVGCGNGYFALPAARITAPAPVYAVDIDDALLAELDHLADQQSIENIRTLASDARRLTQHLPEAVDVVLIANTFHGVDDPASLVQQAFESLHADGRLIVINWDAIPRETTQIDGEPRGPPTELRLSPEESAAIVRDGVACTLTETRDHPPYHYAQVFTR